MTIYEEPKWDDIVLVADAKRTFRGIAYKDVSGVNTAVNIVGGDVDLIIKNKASQFYQGTAKKTIDGTLPDAANGIFQFVIEETEFTTTDLGEYDYRIVYTDSAADVYILQQGNLAIV